ncbi:MAG: hypothetical protein AAF203_09985, partial [Pseudomonadota bacterium]
MTVANAVLITHENRDLSHHGIDTIAQDQTEVYFSQSQPSVVAFHCKDRFDLALINTLAREKAKNPSQSLILLDENLPGGAIADIHNRLQVFRVLPYALSDQLPEKFQEGFSEYYRLEQTKKLAEMVNEKNDELK